MAIEAAYDLPDPLERPRQVEDVEARGDVAREWLEDRGDLGVGGRGGDEPAVPVSGDHRGRPGEEIAEVVPELSLVALAHALDRGDAVLAERHRASAPEPHGIRAVNVDQVERVEDVPERLRDLAVVEQEIPVHEELARHVVSRREQHRRPVDAVEPQDVLGQQVSRRRASTGARGPRPVSRTTGRSGS